MCRGAKGAHARASMDKGSFDGDVQHPTPNSSASRTALPATRSMSKSLSGAICHGDDHLPGGGPDCRLVPGHGPAVYGRYVDQPVRSTAVDIDEVSARGQARGGDEVKRQAFLQAVAAGVAGMTIGDPVAEAVGRSVAAAAPSRVGTTEVQQIDHAISLFGDGRIGRVVVEIEDPVQLGDKVRIVAGFPCFRGLPRHAPGTAPSRSDRSDQASLDRSSLVCPVPFGSKASNP